MTLVLFSDNSSWLVKLDWYHPIEARPYKAAAAAIHFWLVQPTFCCMIPVGGSEKAPAGD
jgi:hypothetical protein